MRSYRLDAIAAEYCKEPLTAVELRANVLCVRTGSGRCCVPVRHHRFIPDGQLPDLGRAGRVARPNYGRNERRGTLCAKPDRP